MWDVQGCCALHFIVLICLLSISIDMLIDFFWMFINIYFYAQDLNYVWRTSSVWIVNVWVSRSKLLLGGDHNSLNLLVMHVSSAVEKKQNFSAFIYSIQLGRKTKSEKWTKLQNSTRENCALELWKNWKQMPIKEGSSSKSEMKNSERDVKSYSGVLTLSNVNIRYTSIF